MKTLISNGSYKFHLAPLASEMASRGSLAGFLTAGWPKGWQKRFAERRSDSVAWQRFLDRSEPISDSLVWSSPMTEFFLKIGDMIRIRSKRFQHYFHLVGFAIFAAMASRALIWLRPSLYHYRCCYGGFSIKLARLLGIPTLCDHSVAHPQVADFMVDNEGAFPPIGTDTIRWPISRQAERDLWRADHVLVNSHFVKQTCIHAGMDGNRIHVVYLGVDDKFLSAMPSFDQRQIENRSKRLLYAGGWQVRKGVSSLVAALKDLTQPWEIDVIAGVEPELKANPDHQRFFDLPNVNLVGTLPRAELASKFTEHSIFVFPSYCEGSARVIFEAMAAGCYIITTPNAGSVVEDRIHGRLIPPGDVDGLRVAIEEALTSTNEVSSIGWQNAQLVRERFRQADYGNSVTDLYSSLLNPT